MGGGIVHKIKRAFWILFLVFVPGFLYATPIDDLKRDNPVLARLATEYANYQSGFSQYANQQGFRKPYENLATAIHETIHLASAMHAGYFIDGVYYEPYIGAEHWPSLRNRDIAPLMQSEEKGIIYSVYMRATPNNNLGNILDEVNAYTHVLGFICRHEPESAGRQAVNLIGHLHVVEAYLRVTRTNRPDEYAKLIGDRLSAGAITTITTRAWSALLACGLSAAQLPRGEADYFNRQRQ